MMLIVSYDISSDKVRTRFSKFLEKYGYRLQYSVFELKNSERLLTVVIEKIEGQFAKDFGGSDSVLVFNVNDGNVRKYGNAIHRDKDVVII